MSRRLAVLLILIVAGLVTSATFAWAHPPVLAPAETTETAETVGVAATDMIPAPEWRSPPSRLSSPWLALTCVVACLVAISRRPRRSLVIAIVFVLAIFTFEHGVHSVHHLDNPAAGATCAVASATTQLAGMPVDAPLLSHMALPLLYSGLPDSSAKVDLCCRSAHQGRAPPLAA